MVWHRRENQGGSDSPLSQVNYHGLIQNVLTIVTLIE